MWVWSEAFLRRFGEQERGAGKTIVGGKVKSRQILSTERVSKK